MLRIPVTPGPPMVLPEFSLRSRREQPVRDVFNARQYEHWNSDFPQPVTNKPELTKQAPHYDMKPVNSRTLTTDFRQAQPFVANAKDQLSGNPYFQKYDVTSDPRNVARELRATVYEYNAPREGNVNQHLLERNFESRYIPEPIIQATYEKAVDVYAGMRPKMNNMKATFR